MSTRFARYGRAWHLEIDDAASLREVLTLDDALWIATSAPINTLLADPGFLAFLDSDNDGRIRLTEVKDAARWLLDSLSDASGVKQSGGPVSINAIKDPSVKAAASMVLARLGATAGGTVSIAQVRQARAEEEAKGLATADRVLPAAAGDDAALQAFIEHAIDVTGGEAHPGGGSALSAASLATFRADLAAWVAWEKAGELPAEGKTATKPLGASTADASAALAAVSAKLDEYFTLCDAASVDPGVADRAWPTITLGEGNALFDVAAVSATLEKAPLAKPRPDGKLSMLGAVNPAWAGRLKAFFASAATPLGAGTDLLDRNGLATVRAAIAPFDGWTSSKPRDAAKGRDAAVVAAHLAGDELAAKVTHLLERSQESAAVVTGFASAERLALYQAHLVDFCRSFVSCADLFDKDRQPLFNMGSLIADGRRFRLAIKVPDKGRSVTFAGMSSTFLVYANVGSKAGTWDYEVVVPVTAGERGTLIEGAFCAFIDREGKEKLAQINKVVSNPISIMEALTAPFENVQRAVEGYLEKRQADSEAELTAKAQAAAVSAADKAVSAASSAGTVALDAASAAATAPPPGAAPAVAAAAAAPPPPKEGMGAAGMTAMFTGGSIAVAALGSAAALIGGFLSSLSPLGIIAIGVALVGAFVVPTALLAWLKLRRRDVAALLEGSGWGVNHRLLIERPVAIDFTEQPELPTGSKTRGADSGDGPLPAILWTLFIVALVGSILWALRGPIGDLIGVDLGGNEAPAAEVAPAAEAPAAPAAP